jgi:hypothetical protein
MEKILIPPEQIRLAGLDGLGTPRAPQCPHLSPSRRRQARESEGSKAKRPKTAQVSLAFGLVSVGVHLTLVALVGVANYGIVIHRAR